jgi:hypothetical protein
VGTFCINEKLSVSVNMEVMLGDFELDILITPDDLSYVISDDPDKFPASLNCIELNGPLALRSPVMIRLPVKFTVLVDELNVKLFDPEN